MKINNLYNRLIRALSNIPYWLRTHTYNRYHIINLKSPAHGYNWGWIDRDRALLLANFKILSDFVEKELPHGMVSEESDDPTAQSWRAAFQEMIALYNWWHQDYPQLLETCMDQGKLSDLEDLQLMRLIKIRGYMWT